MDKTTLYKMAAWEINLKTEMILEYIQQIKNIWEGINANDKPILDEKELLKLITKENTDIAQWALAICGNA